MISIFMLIKSVSASELVFDSKSAILKHFKNDIANTYGLDIDEKTIVVIDAELNNDGLNDYWVLYPDKQCTSQECFGHVYLNTSEGYCFAGTGMKETDLNFGRKTLLKCKTGMK